MRACVFNIICSDPESSSPRTLGQRDCYNIWFSKTFHLNWSAQILMNQAPIKFYLRPDPFLWAQVIQFNSGGKLLISQRFALLII